MEKLKLLPFFAAMFLLLYGCKTAPAAQTEMTYDVTIVSRVAETTETAQSIAETIEAVASTVETTIAEIQEPAGNESAEQSEPESNATIVNVKDTVNVRANSSIDSEKVGEYKKGERIYVEKISRNNGRNWALTGLGWVYMDYVQIDTEVISEIEIEDSEPVTTIAEDNTKNTDRGTELHSQNSWKKLYYDFIINDYEQMATNYEDYTYELLFVDEDDIPELWINRITYASGTLFATIHNGEVKQISTEGTYAASAACIKYIDKGNIFSLSNAHQSYGYIDICKLSDGELQKIAGGIFEPGVDSEGKPDVMNLQYKWEGESVSGEKFYNIESSYYGNASPVTAGIGGGTSYSYEEILAYLAG